MRRFLRILSKVGSILGIHFAKETFRYCTLQSSWVRERLRVGETELLTDLRLLLSNETQIRGADVYRYVMKKIWWAYPFYLLSITPVLRRVFDWSYRTFADNRYRFSSACGLPHKPSI